MRKLLTSLILLILILVLGLPFVMGFAAKNKFETFISNLSSTPNLKYEIKSYERGWWQSKTDVLVTGTTEKELPGITPSTNTFHFTIHETIKHGPIIFDQGKVRFGIALAKSTFELGPELKTALATVLAKQILPPLQGELLFKLGGAVRAAINWPAFTVVSPDMRELQWKGLNIYWVLTHGMKKISGGANLEGFELISKAEKQPGKVSLGKTTLSFIQREVEGLWVGKGDFNLSNLNIQKENKTLFSLDNFKLSSITALANKLVSLNVDVDINHWQFKEASYGPAQLKLALNKIDSPTLLEIKQKLEVANDPTLAEQQRQLMMVAIFTQVPKLVEKGAEFRIDKLEVKTPEGQVSAHAKISLTNSNTSNGRLEILQILNRLQVESDITVPTELVKKNLMHAAVNSIRKKQLLLKVMADHNLGNAKQATDLTDEQIQQQATAQVNQQLDQWTKAGYLITKANAYVINIRYTGGKLTLNGKETTSSQATPPNEPAKTAPLMQIRPAVKHP